MPDPQFNFLPTGVWGDEYRDAGGVVVPEFLARQKADLDQRQAAYDAYQQEQDATSAADAQRTQQADFAQKQQQFVDWPTYQQIIAGKVPNPRDQYDEYVQTALPAQLKYLGYSDDEIAQEVQAFAKMVQPPASDKGFFGNLWDSLKSGVTSGTQAEKATGALTTGNLDDLAKLVVEQSTTQNNPAPLQKFQQAVGGNQNAPVGPGGQQLGGGTDFDFGKLWGSIKDYASATYDNPQGALDFTVQQLAQSYPVLAAGLAGAGVGALAGPVGAFAGGIGGTAAGSASLEVGSQILERISNVAQQRNIDLNDANAIAALIKDPSVYNELRDAAVAKGLTVGAADGVIAAFSAGLGRYAVGAARAGKPLRAAAAVPGGLAVESIGGAGGEALSQKAAGDEFSYTDIVGEAFGELGPGAGHIAMGAAHGLAFPNRTQVPGVTPPIEPSLEEGDLPAGGAPPPPVPTLTGGVVPNANPTLAVGPEGGAFVPTPENVAARDRALASQLQVSQPTVENIDIPGIPGQSPEQIDVTHPTVEEITIPPVSQILDNADTRIERLLEFKPNAPLTVTPEGTAATAQQLEDARVAHAATPQPVDLNVKDPDNIRAWMSDRGISLTPTQSTAVDLLAHMNQRDRPAFIADVISHLEASPNVGDAPFADALMAIARNIPREPKPKDNLLTALGAQAKTLVITAAVQDVVNALNAGVTDATAPTEPTATTPATTAAGATAVRRGLRAGERVPTPSLSNLAHQLVGEPGAGAGPAAGSNNATATGRGVAPGVGGAGTVQKGPRSGLRARRTQEVAAPGAGGVVAGGVTEAAGRPAVNLGKEPGDLGSTPGVPRLIRGTQYGSQVEDVANKEAVQQQRTDQRAKRASGLARKLAIDAVTMTKEEYESTYPGRNYEKDLQNIVSADRLDGTENNHKVDNEKLLSLQHQSATEILNWIASVAPNPLMRAVARELATLNLPTMFRLRTNFGSAGKYLFGKNPDRTVAYDAVIVDPYSKIGPTLETILHEFVHAASLHNYTYPKNEAQRTAKKQMDALFAYVKANMPEGSKHYGMTDVGEFIAEGLSNPEFQAFLDNIPMPQSKVSVGTAFKQLISNLIGKFIKPDTALTNLLNSVEPLLTAEKGAVSVSANAAPTPSAKAPSAAILGTKDDARTFIAYPKGDTFTLYPTDPQNMRGVRGAGVAGLSRAQVEQHIEGAGSVVIPPVADTRTTGGTPKNTSTKLVGFSNEGDLRVAAFEQKDGTWTYYQSDADVRTDPDARVQKGLTKDQAQRYITQAGLLTEAPTAGAVQPNATSSTAVGYDPANQFRITWQDSEAALRNIGGDIDREAALRNSRVDAAIRRAKRIYVEPARKAGETIARQFGKTDADIMGLLANLHIMERMPVKMQQFMRGNLPSNEQAAKIRELQKKLDAAKKAVDDARNANPSFVQAVQQDLAPKVKALTDNTIDLQAQYGLISRDTAEQIKKAYDYYVPLQTGDKTSVAKAATGSNVETDRSFPRLVEQMARTIARGEQNRVRKMVLDLVRQSGLIRNDTKESPVHVGSKTVVRWDPETNSLNEGTDNNVFGENRIDVFENGVRTPMTITEPSLLEALHPYKGEQRKTAATLGMAMLAKLNRVISIGKTTLSPAFSPFNFARDLLTANINMPQGVSRVKFNLQLLNPETYASVLYNVAKEGFGGEATGKYSKAREAGAFISHRAFLGLDEVSHDVDALFKPGPKANFKAATSRTFDVLSIWAQAFESFTRYAVYKAAIDSGMTEAQAAHAGKTASVNFEQRGLKNPSNYWIFGNAKVQGLHALYSTMQQAGWGKATMGLAALTTLGAMAAALGYENSDKDKDGKSKYTKIPNYKKDSLVLFKEGAPGIPIPQEVSPFYALGHAFAEYKMGGVSGGETISRVFTAFLNNLWPGNIPQQEVAGHKANQIEFLMRAVLPSYVSPGVDLMTNHNTFGSEVVQGKADKLKRGVPLSEMGSANENQLAVNTAKGLYNATGGNVDVAPQQLKLVHNYLDPATEGFAFFRDIFGLRDPKYQGDIVDPIARKFTGAATPFYDQDQFDELKAQATRAKYLADHHGINSLTPEDQVLARSAQMLNKVEKDSKDLFKGDKLMTPERRAMLQDRSNTMLLDGIRRYNELRDRTIRSQ